MKKILIALLFAVLLNLTHSEIQAVERGAFFTEHDLLVIAPPEIIVDNQSVTVQRLTTMANFTGDLICTAEVVATVISRPSGRLVISSVGTLPMPGQETDCEFRGQSITGTIRGTAQGEGGILEGVFSIRGTVTSETGDSMGFLADGTTYIDMGASTPAQLNGFFVLTP
jgi:hypothetical protein